jgi:hypothetical protein
VVVVVVELVVVVPEMVVVVVVVVVMVVVPKMVVVVVEVVVVEVVVVLLVVVVVLLVGVVVEVVLVVVELLVVVVGPHAGSAGSVQEQSGFVLQFVTNRLLARAEVHARQASACGTDLFRAGSVRALPRRSCFGDKDARPERDRSQRDNRSPNHRHRGAPLWPFPHVNSDFGALPALRARLRPACQGCFWTKSRIFLD